LNNLLAGFTLRSQDICASDEDEDSQNMESE
jgi:hypothetical protein